MKRACNRGFVSLSGLIWLSACAPTANYRSANLTDPSAEVIAKPAGMATNPAGQSVSENGRINIDCFMEQIDATAAGVSENLQSIGIPSNCPRSSKKSQTSSAETDTKFDVAVVLDTSENMLKSASKAKVELGAALGKLLAEQRIASLAAISFRTSLGTVEKGSDFAKTISLLTGTEPDWTPNSLKVVDPNSSDWINNTAAKAVFPAVEEALGILKSGSQKSKILILVSGSTGKGKSGFDIGPTAKMLSEFSEALTSQKGQLTFNYAASNTLAAGLSEYAPSPIAQLDLISAAAAIKPVRAELSGALGGWGERVVSEAKEAALNVAEDCIVSQLEGFDPSGKSVFVKELKVTDKNGFQDTSLPKILVKGSFKLAITRQCESSGVVVQNVTVKQAQGE